MMVGIALVIAAASFAFAPSAAQQSVVTPSVDSAALLANGVPSRDGYTDRIIEGLHARLQQSEADYAALSQLGIAYLQKARETNDPTYYGQAEQALGKALDFKPDDYDATAAMGALGLSRHDFAGALDWGMKARALNPHKAYGYGVIGDAQVELGRYDEAIATFQQMVDLRPDLSSYSRVSYARELYGDVPGAIEAMQQAVEAGSPAAENTAWTRVQLGHLYFNSGQLDRAEKEYNNALYSYPGYLHAQAGLAQVRAAQGRTDEAIKLYEQSVAGVPLPQYLTALGDLYASQGNVKAATERYDLVSFIYSVFEKNGVNADIEKAAFLAYRGSKRSVIAEGKADAAEAVRLAQSAARERQDVNTHDTLAWALYRAGRYQEALAAEQNALRLGTRNAMFYFHLGMIYEKSGDHDRARQELQKALDINPYFNLKYAREAADVLGK
jgi:tetratricopeptide (TPR) repeat protein